MKNCTSNKEIDKKRRQFMSTAGKAAVVAPAVALLMSANMKSAHAVDVDPYRQPPQDSGPL